MNIEEGKERGVTSTGNPPQPGVADYPPQQAIGSFQGVADYPPKPVVGFPQPGPPPVGTYSSAPPPPPQFYADGNQAGPGPGYPVSEAAPAAREPDRLFCWGLGVGWLLFILGFIFGVIPWYVGAIMLLCVKKKDYKREKPGYIACAIFAVIGTVLIVVEVTTKYA
ncbi:large ribosomal subunit protein eL20z-like isoform X1 [Rhododendron vialii]|uniref:large ribosomal subunit protein eL20z-like isoform X1 n=1 Tax=Rhododendron vialii TaxID=182163 RepID=UPI00265DDEA9|nr:large ribosomal subunit protein eL20z-like isoform X1 [Rhododendron vialii]XP_058218052.1 large ribosomal subunit protein eL20z-like isoform X1 [Rhododendron vialii]